MEARHEYLTAAEAAELLRTPERTLQDFRYKRTGPRYSKLGKRVVYRRQDLVDWIESRAVEPEPPRRG